MTQHVRTDIYCDVTALSDETTSSPKFLYSGDLPLSLSVGPGQSDCRSNRRFISRDTAGERTDETSAGPSIDGANPASTLRRIIKWNSAVQPSITTSTVKPSPPMHRLQSVAVCANTLALAAPTSLERPKKSIVRCVGCFISCRADITGLGARSSGHCVGRTDEPRAYTTEVASRQAYRA
jgi:hypothetical protein